MKRTNLFILLRLLISISLLTFLLRKINWEEILEVIKNINLFYLILVFLISFFLIGISCFKWQILLKVRGIKISLFRLIILYIIGYFFNNFMLGSVGGDAVRGFVLGKRIKSQVESFASIFMERFTGFTALVAIAFTVSFINYPVWKEPRLAFFLIIVFLGYSLFLLLIYNRALFDKIKRSFILKHSGKIKEKLIEFYEAIHSFKTRKKVVGNSLLISLVFHLMTSVNVLIVSLALGLNIQIIDILLVVPLILLVSMIPISIAGWGLWEGAFVYFFTQIGISAPCALSIALILRAKNLIIALLGGILFSFKKTYYKPRNKE